MQNSKSFSGSHFFWLDTMMGLLWVLGNCEAKWGQVSELMVTWYNCNWVFETGNVVIGRKTNVRDGTFSESWLGKLFVFEVMKLWSCEGFGCEQLCDSEVWRVSIAMNVWHLLPNEVLNMTIVKFIMFSKVHISSIFPPILKLELNPLIQWAVKKCLNFNIYSVLT